MKKNALCQRTVNEKVSVTGIGLHTGEKVKLSLLPAPVNTGICFRRTDLKHSHFFKLNPNCVSGTLNGTTVSSNGRSISTIEHLMAVIYSFGINNLFCEVDGPEVPIMDGSSAPFVYLLKEAGIKEQAAKKKFLVVKETVEVKHQNAWSRIEPSDSLSIDATIEFNHPKIKTQREEFSFSCQQFAEKVAKARTFGLLKDVDYLKRNNLIKGGSLDNAVVLDEFGIMNPEGLRCQNEFVKHKILDVIGDMSLLGVEIVGKITTFKPGHFLNNILCKEILSRPSSYELVDSSLLEENFGQIYELPLFIPNIVTNEAI